MIVTMIANESHRIPAAAMAPRMMRCVLSCRMRGC